MKAKPKSKSKKKQKNKLVPPVFKGWITTDSDEIELRRFRGRTEAFESYNNNPEHQYFSNFTVTSKTKQSYQVEIRSLTECINSCDCPDYRNNELGTCKHIEHVLFNLGKKAKNAFKAAAEQGSNFIEIFLDHRTYILRIIFPKNNSADMASAIKAIDTFFSSDGSLLGDPVLAYDKLCSEISDIDTNGLLRVSRHIEHFIEYRKAFAKRQMAKEVFLNDIASGKQTADILKHPLYEYQKEGMMHLAFNERALLADEMGLGKTVQAVAACELLRLKKHISKVLIVATASLKAEWEEQITKFTGLSMVIVHGARKDRLKLYQQQAFFYITNYEQIIYDGEDIIRLIAPDVVILDEAQRIKNWQTKTANSVKKLKSKYAFVLTGTPLENRIDDIYSIMQFLDPKIFGPLFRFNRNFYELNEKGRPIGCKNLDELHKRIRPITLRRRKSDVEDQLPDRTTNNYFVAMSEEQSTRYEEYKMRVARILAFAKRRCLTKEEHEKLQKFLAAMRMMCDSPYIMDDSCKVSPKIGELENVLEDLLVDGATKILIFSEWERMLQLVRELVQRKGIDFAWHTGLVPQQKRRQEINRFKKDENCRLFLSTDSGSIGLNLQAANVVINMDLPWTPAKLEQRIARAWRKHQTRSVNIINLISEDTIEHRMLDVLSKKTELATAVLEGTTTTYSTKQSSIIQRLEDLMQVTQEQAQPQNQITEVFDVAHNAAKKVISHMGDNLNMLQSYYQQEIGQRTLLAVTNETANSKHSQLKQALSCDAINLETIDQKTFDSIIHLAKLGILTLNVPMETFLDQNKDFGADDMFQARLEEARVLFNQALRKQRMAKILADDEFFEEAVAPLEEVFALAIKAFSKLVARECPDKITIDFVRNILIQQFSLPCNAEKLFENLNQKTDEINGVYVADLISDTQALLNYIDASLSNKIDKKLCVA